MRSAPHSCNCQSYVHFRVGHKIQDKNIQNATNSEWTKTIWYTPHICTVEYYSALKGTNLEDISSTERKLLNVLLVEAI